MKISEPILILEPMAIPEPIPVPEQIPIPNPIPIPEPIPDLLSGIDSKKIETSRNRFQKNSKLGGIDFDQNFIFPITSLM